MLRIYRRHLKSCSHTSRSYLRCSCPIWVQGTLAGETISRALDVTTIEAASKLILQWRAAGTIGGQKVEPTRIETAVMKYLDDARARDLAKATITKLTTIFERQFLKFAKDHGYRFLKTSLPIASPRGVRRGKTRRSPPRRSTSASSASSTSACA